jgi:hypothetical protein
MEDDHELRRLQFLQTHSASYAQVSFKSAYLRPHYPAVFMAAVISQGWFYRPSPMTRKLGAWVWPSFYQR